MATSDLQTALDSLDSQIASLAAKAASPSSYSMEGLAVVRRKLTELIKARKDLAELIAGAGDSIYEVHSRWVP